MKPNSLFFIFISFIFLFPSLSFAQQIEGYEKKQVDSYQAKAEDQVRFLEYLLNTLGSETASPRDKDVIIRESYLKIFRDSKVQIEDDLNENRTVLLNKDVTAYLKDIDFFFQKAHFDFEIQSTEPFLRDNGELSFKIELKRTLKATGIEGEAVLNVKTRFVEINLNPENDELQVASIYTTKVSRDKALKEWWDSLSLSWKNLFKYELSTDSDSLTINQLNKIASIDSINLSNNAFIVGIEPLSFLVDLKYVNLSYTKIQDIAPLSSLTELKELNISNTAITDLSFLRYAEKMQRLNISFTPVQKIEPLKNLTDLRELILTGADVRDFQALENFTKLRVLDLSETFFSELESLAKMQNLEELNMSRSNLSVLSENMSPKTLKSLDISFAFVSDLQPLRNYKSLEIININNTQVESLETLASLQSLQKIYADNTFVTEGDINDFIDENTDKLLIVNSEELSDWWISLNESWRNVLSDYIEGTIYQNPQKEQLTKLLLRDSLNLNRKGLTDLSPLQKFSRLRYLSISNNPIVNLIPIENLNSLAILDAENIGLTSAQSILKIKKLKHLNLAHNKLSEDTFLQFSRLNNLSELNVDDCGVDKEMVRKFLSEKVSGCSVIYDSLGMHDWWDGLDKNWQSIFRFQFPLQDNATTKEIHDLAAMKRVYIVDEEIESLAPLAQFVQLENVYLERVGLSDLETASVLTNCKDLTIKGCPINDLEPLAQLEQLRKLDLDNSAVSNLKPLKNLSNLEYLSVAGTQVKSINGVQSLADLRYLNVSSTRVRWIGKLKYLDNMEEFVCFNTRIWKSGINSFINSHPDCVVSYY